ncbi:YciI family protein [Cereibacter sphaeroides]|nr:YciI family protein [Cereibacter sphaeroides]
MYFLMRCTHRENADEARDALRPAHREWNRSGANGLVSVITGSALWTDEGVALGHWGVIEAASMADARTYIEGDPFVTGGVVTGIELTRMADGFAADRINPRLTV